MPVEVFSTQTNAALVRMPGRRFPGLVIQGDSLSILAGDLAEARACMDALDQRPEAREELAGILAGMESKVLDYLAAYEQILGEHGIPLPYVPRGK